MYIHILFLFSLFWLVLSFLNFNCWVSLRWIKSCHILYMWNAIILMTIVIRRGIRSHTISILFYFFSPRGKKKTFIHSLIKRSRLQITSTLYINIDGRSSIISVNPLPYKVYLEHPISCKIYQRYHYIHKYIFLICNVLILS